MNADQIRGLEVSRSWAPEVLEETMIEMLREIAAQLAEANDHLAKIVNPMMVVKAESPWVSFSDGKTLVMIDRTQVHGVRRSGPEHEMMSEVSTHNGSYMVEGTVVNVCAKLGIPMEEK